ncbi:MAG: hypothetical protein KAX49_11705 [Halanaerobiales bacterium]|nr:hypothetical protein [Halanaerobiales bacterium]
MVISTHLDADGISAGYLYGLAIKDSNINLNEFGIVTEGSTCVIDMHPNSDPDYSELVIDHHPGHPIGKELKYKLIYDTVPASAIVWNNFYKDIPHEEHWKAAIGCVGDMQSYSIPTQIWNDFPILREKFTQLYGWKHTPFSLRVYQKLSSGINALSRMGQAFLALEVIEEAENPVDLIMDPRCEDARDTLKKETNSLLSDIKLVECDSVIFGSISSELTVGGRIATQLSNDLKSTTVIQNMEGGHFSIRGDLTVWVKERLQKNAEKLENVELEVGGHPMASGGKVTPAYVNILELFQDDV